MTFDDLKPVLSSDFLRFDLFIGNSVFLKFGFNNRLEFHKGRVQKIYQILMDMLRKKNIDYNLLDTGCLSDRSTK